MIESAERQDAENFSFLSRDRCDRTNGAVASAGDKNIRLRRRTLRSRDQFRHRSDTVTVHLTSSPFEFGSNGLFDVVIAGTSRPGIQNDRHPLAHDPSVSLQFEQLAACREIDESVCRVRGQKFNVNFLSDLESLFAADNSPIDRRPENSCKRAVISNARHDRVIALADMTFHHRSGDDLSHLSFDFSGGSLLQIAVFGDRVQFILGVRLRLAPDRGLYHSLNDDIRISPVRRSRVGIITHT